MKKTALILLMIIVALTFAACVPPQTENGAENIPVQPPTGGEGEGEESVPPDEPTEPPYDGWEEEPEDPTDPWGPPYEEEEPEPVVDYDVLLCSTTDGLSVRSGAGTRYSVLGRLDKDDAVALVSDLGNGWYETVYKERRAYVAAQYVKKLYFVKGEIPVENVIDEGKRQLGYPYVWGSQRYHWGNGVLNPSFVSGEFDCSALMQYIFYIGKGTLLGTTSRAQAVQGRAVSELKRGDLMFFTNSTRYYYSGIDRVGHVAVYLGNNYILHTASDFAVIEPISQTRWNYFLFARRN